MPRRLCSSHTPRREARIDMIDQRDKISDLPRREITQPRDNFDRASLLDQFNSIVQRAEKSSSSALSSDGQHLVFDSSIYDSVHTKGVRFGGSDNGTDSNVGAAAPAQARDNHAVSHDGAAPMLPGFDRTHHGFNGAGGSFDSHSRFEPHFEPMRIQPTALPTPEWLKPSVEATNNALDTASHYTGRALDLGSTMVQGAAQYIAEHPGAAARDAVGGLIVGAALGAALPAEAVAAVGVALAGKQVADVVREDGQAIRTLFTAERGSPEYNAAQRKLRDDLGPQLADTVVTLGLGAAGARIGAEFRGQQHPTERPNQPVEHDRPADLPNPPSGHNRPIDVVNQHGDQLWQSPTMRQEISAAVDRQASNQALAHDFPRGGLRDNTVICNDPAVTVDHPLKPQQSLGDNLTVQRPSDMKPAESPLIYVNAANDPALRTAIAEVRERFGPDKFPDPVERAAALQQYVRERLGGTDIDDAAFNRQSRQLAGQVVPLGQYLQEGQGNCFIQSAMLSRLGQEVGLEMQMVSGWSGERAAMTRPDGTRYEGPKVDHTWTVLHTPGQQDVVFDPRRGQQFTGGHQTAISMDDLNHMQPR